LQGGGEGVKPGEKCVLFKERGVMVVGLSFDEWRVLVEKQPGARIEMQMIAGVEEAVVRGLSQSDGLADASVELKMSWNLFSLRLCEGKEGEGREGEVRSGIAWAGRQGGEAGRGSVRNSLGGRGGGRSSGSVGRAS
jgi:hypothetical protein